MTERTIPPTVAEADAEPLNPFRLTPARRHTLFVSLMLSNFFLFAAYCSAGAVFMPTQIAMIDEASKETNLAIVMSISSLATLFVQPIVGALSDRTISRFGRRTPWMVLGGLSGGVVVILMQFASTVAYIAIGWVLAQMLLNAFQGPMTTLIADRVEYRHRAFGSSFVGVGQALGISGGMAIAGNMLDRIGIGYTVFGSAMIVWTLVFVLVNRDRSTVGTALPRFSWKEFALGFVRPLNFRKHPDFVWAFAGRFFMVLGYQAIQAYGLYILTDYIGLPTDEAGRTLGTMSIMTMVTMMIGTIVFGKVSDVAARRKVFVFGASALMAVSIAIPLVVPMVGAMYAYAVLVGIGYGAYVSVDMALMIDVLPSTGDAGKDLGVLNIASNIPQTLVPLFAAGLLAMFGGNYAVIFVYAIVGVLVSSLCIFPIKSVR